MNHPDTIAEIVRLTHLKASWQRSKNTHERLMHIDDRAMINIDEKIQALEASLRSSHPTASA